MSKRSKIKKNSLYRSIVSVDQARFEVVLERVQQHNFIPHPEIAKDLYDLAYCASRYNKLQLRIRRTGDYHIISYFQCYKKAAKAGYFPACEWLFNVYLFGSDCLSLPRNFVRANEILNRMEAMTLDEKQMEDVKGKRNVFEFMIIPIENIPLQD